MSFFSGNGSKSVVVSDVNPDFHATVLSLYPPNKKNIKKRVRFRVGKPRQKRTLDFSSVVLWMEVMSCSHAGGTTGDHAATVFLQMLKKNEQGEKKKKKTSPYFTSPPGWGPYCWGCPVTGRTKKSRRCPRSSPESPTRRTTPVVGKRAGPSRSAGRIH